MEGVVKLFDVSPPALVCSNEPAVNAEYHLNVPTVALLAETVTVPVPQREPGVPVGAAQPCAYNPCVESTVVSKSKTANPFISLE